MPPYQPKQLSLGPLETEILSILWNLGSATAREIHEEILKDPDRELAYASVMTVLQRLTQKGWLACNKDDRSFIWIPLLSQTEAQALRSMTQLQQFLSMTPPDTVAAFADHLDQASVEQLQAIAARIQKIRQSRESL
jgi:predicted transcriptional regulator